MKNRWKPTFWMFGASFLSLICCAAALWANWFEFKVDWNPPKITNDLRQVATSAESIGLFAGPAVRAQACYSSGSCGRSFQDSAPRLHRSNLSTVQTVGLALFLVPALLITSLVVGTNLVFLLLGGWKAILPFLVIVPIGVIILFLGLPPTFLMNFLQQQFLGGETLPDWNSCQTTYQPMACTRAYNDCVKRNEDGSCSFQSVDKTAFLRVNGSADWEFAGLSPAGPLLMAGALLLVAPGVLAFRREMRASHTPGPHLYP